MIPTFQELPVARILTPPQVRQHFGEDELVGLATNISKAGLLQPIRVTPVEGGWQLVAGARRLEVARRLGWATIPAIVDASELSDADTAWHQLSENVQRADLTPIELARGIERLMEQAEWSASKAADELGLSAATVSKLRSLLVLPEALQQAVHTGRLAASTAYEIAKVRDPKERARLTQAALAGRLTRTAVTSQAKARHVGVEKGSAARRKPVPHATIALGKGRTIRFNGPELSPGAAISWLEELLQRIRGLPVPATNLSTWVAALSAGKDS